MRKAEGIPIVSEKLFFSLDTSCRLHKHDTQNWQFCSPKIEARESVGLNFFLSAPVCVYWSNVRGSPLKD